VRSTVLCGLEVQPYADYGKFCRSVILFSFSWILRQICYAILSTFTRGLCSQDWDLNSSLFVGAFLLWETLLHGTSCGVGVKCFHARLRTTFKNLFSFSSIRNIEFTKQSDVMLSVSLSPQCIFHQKNCRSKYKRFVSATINNRVLCHIVPCDEKQLCLNFLTSASPMTSCMVKSPKTWECVRSTIVDWIFVEILMNDRLYQRHQRKILDRVQFAAQNTKNEQLVFLNVSRTANKRSFQLLSAVNRNYLYLTMGRKPEHFSWFSAANSIFIVMGRKLLSPKILCNFNCIFLDLKWCS